MKKMFPIIILLLQLTSVYTDSHTLRYYYTGVSAPGSGLPEFSIVGYVDDREIVNYNSHSGRMQPRVEWMKNEGPEYWDRETQKAKGGEPVFRYNVKTVMERFNQTAGFHTFQQMCGCEMGDDGGFIRGYFQYGYDGGEFIALDTQTGKFIATMRQAQITEQKWNSAEVQEGERHKNYLENICIGGLRRYVEYGRADLERRDQPKVKVSGQEKDGTLTLHCQAYGFHPRAVDVKWMKNGDDEVPAYQTTHILPNPDGTYQIRVSAEVIPKEGDSYSCKVEHSSLKEPLSIVWEPEVPGWVIPVGAAAVVAFALLALGVSGFLLYRKRKNGYKTASTSDTSSDSSNIPAKA